MNNLSHKFDAAQTAEEKKAQIQKQALLVTTFLSIVGPKIEVEFDANGIDRTITIAGKEHRVSRDAKGLESGTLCQTPGAVSVPPETVERNIQDDVLSILQEGHGIRDVNVKNFAATITRMLIDGVWHQVDDQSEIEDLARSLRRLPTNLRPSISKMGSKAFELGGNEGFRRLAQAINAAPIITRIIDADELVKGVVEGRSPVAIATEAGGSKILTHLAKNSLPLVTKKNVGSVVKALEAVRSASIIPKAKQQNEWLRKLLNIITLDEPADGFFDWLSDRTAWHQVHGDFSAAEVSYHTLFEWAQSTAGQQRGWSDQKSLAAAFTAATEWSEREQKRALAEADQTPPFPVHFRQYEDDSSFVRQIGSASQMIETGTLMGNCLASMTHRFAKHAQDGRCVYVTVNNKKTQGNKWVPGAPRSAAEIVFLNDGTISVKQHYGRYNKNPSPRDVEIIDRLVQKLAAQNEATDE